MVEPNPALFTRIYRLVALIPAGMVSSYGDIAAMVGGGCTARTVGEALAALGAGSAAVPWQRVVAQSGAISTRGLLQRDLLAAEGVDLDARGRVVMARRRWAGPDPAWAAANGYAPLPPRDEPEQLGLL